MADRKKRNTGLQDTIDLSLPVDILNIYKLGGSEDPCFGKLHDLTANECMRCGDSELCQIATQQRQTLERSNDPAKYMDKEFDNLPRVKKTIKRLAKLGKTDEEIIAKVVKRFSLTKQEVKKIIKTL